MYLSTFYMYIVCTLLINLIKMLSFSSRKIINLNFYYFLFPFISEYFCKSCYNTTTLRTFRGRNKALYSKSMTVLQYYLEELVCVKRDYTEKFDLRITALSSFSLYCEVSIMLFSFVSDSISSKKEP